MYLYPRKRAEERRKERREKKQWCQVPGCPNLHNPRKTSFKVPSDNERRLQWCENLKINRSLVKTNSRFVVCDDHFDNDQFWGTKRLRLKPNAVPRATVTANKKGSLTTSRSAVAGVLPKVTEIVKNKSQILPQVLPQNYVSSSFNVTQSIQPLSSLLRSYVQIPILSNVQPNCSNVPQKYVLSMGVPVPLQSQQSLQHVSFVETDTIPAQNVVDVSSCSLCLISRNCKGKTYPNVQFEANQFELGQFLCTILDLNINLFKDSNNLNFCINCAARIENLREINAQLKMLQIKFENLKNELKNEMVSSYLLSHWNGEQTEFYQKALLEKWISFAKDNCKGVCRPVGREENPSLKKKNIISKLEYTQTNADKKLAANQTLVPNSTLNEPDFEYFGKQERSDSEENENEETAADCSDTRDNIEVTDKVHKITCEGVELSDKKKAEPITDVIMSPSASKILSTKSINKRNTKRRRQCPVCFKRVLFLTGHMLIHTGTKPYKCNICDKRFRQKPHLDFHKSRIHFLENISKSNLSSKQKTRFQCSNCWKEYPCLAKFLCHLRSYHLNNEVSDGDSFWFYDCDAPNCLTSCSTFIGMKHHMGIKHCCGSEDIPEIFECDICNRIFYSSDNLELHRQHHGSITPMSTFGCNYCLLVFNSEPELQQHQLRHKVTFNLSDFKFQCELCGQGFLESQGLLSHQNSSQCVNGKSKVKRKKARNENVKELKDMYKKNTVGWSQKACKVCGKIFASANLRMHMFIHTHPEGFPCPECDLKLKNPRNLEKHMYAVHRKNYVGRQFKHICEFCEHGMSSLKELLQHLALYHPLEYLGDKCYCMVCYQLFKNKSELEVHFQEKHSNFICPIEDCGRKFSQKSNLNRHLHCTHYNSRQYLCSYCPLRFNDSTVLRYHVNVKHTFHRSFLCKLCPKNPGFYERRSLKHHTDKNHPGIQMGEVIVRNKLI